MRNFQDRVNRILNHSKKNFGESCILLPKSGGEIPIVGIFNNSHAFVDADSEQPVSDTHPTLGVNLLDLEIEISAGDRIQIRNIIYKIIDPQEDGQGGATLVLHQVDHGQKIFKKKSN